MRHGQTQHQPLPLLGNSHNLILVDTLKWANDPTRHLACQLTHRSIEPLSP